MTSIPLVLVPRTRCVSMPSATNPKKFTSVTSTRRLPEESSSPTASTNASSMQKPFLISIVLSTMASQEPKPVCKIATTRE